MSNIFARMKICLYIIIFVQLSYKRKWQRKEYIFPKCDKSMKNYYRSLHNRKYCIEKPN